MIRIVLAIATATVLAFTELVCTDDPRLEANKKMVVEFYDKAINQKDFDAAARYFGPRYIQPATTNGMF